ncbi:MAG TPA: PmeII family type II restriction endonuclease [Pyrinomonadaceae bacterium]|nr:PmeII family type II restriction endonuclease [Pyrinomonadaceae bacterium]
MIASSYQAFHAYLAEYVINPFYTSRLGKLKSLKLSTVLKKKNPYLFKAKNLERSQDLIESIVDAYLSSQEETMFGNLLEGFAVYVSHALYGGFKPEKMPSVDLQFERDGKLYIVGIKSGTSWGNADQINAMKSNFKTAKENFRKVGVTKEIVAVNGCIYGRDSHPLKDKLVIRVKGQPPEIRDEEPDKVYYKYAGQDFWSFISGDDYLYREIIKPIDEEARQKDAVFQKAYNAKVNEMTTEFNYNFLIDNLIDWEKLVDYVSKRREPKATTAKRRKRRAD